jgi:hypothetical protein
MPTKNGGAGGTIPRVRGRKREKERVNEEMGSANVILVL